VNENVLVITSRTENLSKVRDFISIHSKNAGLKTNDILDVMLAVDEAVTNIIKHSYSFDPDCEIKIEIFIENNEFIIAITDEGKSFDPNSVPEPDIRKYQKENRVGGFGLYLMKKFMDDVVYSSIPNSYNKTVLKKKIH
jgi:serine/threonine-protein kinase RsbW